MAMTYTTLVAAKGTAGALQSWVNYAKLDQYTVLDEAQALLYQTLRVREMRTQHSFLMALNDSFFALPARFLDPVAGIEFPSLNIAIDEYDQTVVSQGRLFSPFTGTLGTDPFTTTNASSLVSVALAAHGFTQGSFFAVASATAVGGVTPNGAFEIVSITSANAFVIDVGSAATSSATGGGTPTYTCSKLAADTAGMWAIWNERIYFNCAFSRAATGLMRCYKSLPLLSSTNTTNFLTDRYPHLLRTACMAAAADYMKDDGEYQKNVTKLTGLIGDLNAKDDLSNRGGMIYTRTP